VSEAIEFDAEGVTLRGRFYPAAGAEVASGAGASACVVMAHGWAGTAKHFLDDFAEAFAAGGLAVVLHDHRGWGESDTALGEPRHEVDPWRQIRDFQHAISYAQNRPEVDAERIGVWGTSFSAGHCFVLGAIDRRVKAVVGQAPFISGLREFQGLTRLDMEHHAHQAFAADRMARHRGGAPTIIPVVDKDPQAMAGLPTADAFEYFYGPGGAVERDPGWANEITLRSVEFLYGYEPGLYLPRISPTPLLMLVARDDRLAPSDVAFHAFSTAAHPKKLVVLPGGHFDAYRDESAALGQTAARDWFLEHLAS
jgi:dienelactone hydrolase